MTLRLEEIAQRLGQILALGLGAKDLRRRVVVASGRGSLRGLFFDANLLLLLLLGGIGRSHLRAPLVDARYSFGGWKLQLNAGPAHVELLLVETVSYCGCHLYGSVPSGGLIADCEWRQPQSILLWLCSLVTISVAFRMTHIA